MSSSVALRTAGNFDAIFQSSSSVFTILRSSSSATAIDGPAQGKQSITMSPEIYKSFSRIATKVGEREGDDAGRSEAGINIWPIRFGASFTTPCMRHIHIMLLLACNETTL